MSNSAPDTIDISYTNDTGSEYTFNTNANYSTTITGATVGGIVTTDTPYTIDNSSFGTITLTDLDNFERDVLDLSEVEEMCKEYPGLKNVYEKFKHVYDLVKQDWVGKQKDDI